MNTRRDSFLGGESQSSFHRRNNKNFLDASLGGMLELYPTCSRDNCFSKNVSRSVFLFRAKNLGVNFSHFQTAQLLHFEYLFKKFGHTKNAD